MELLNSWRKGLRALWTHLACRGARAVAFFGMTTAVLTGQTLTTLASFNGAKALEPNVLLQASDGNFYGAAASGGLGNCTSFGSNVGCGAIFKITPAGELTTLYNFGLASIDGAHPTSLIQAADGDFYGTTSQGGTANAGTIFRMTPGGTLTTLYNFGNDPSSAGYPTGLIQASDGNFYGTTSNNSTIFKFTLPGTLLVLHVFQGPDGSLPTAGLIEAADGNFYGTTQYGGAGNCAGVTADGSGCGTIFKMTPAGILATLYTFKVSDGANPSTGLVRSTDGNFYGTTDTGGAGKCQNQNNGFSTGGCGTIFKITPGGTLTTLYNFGGAVTDSALTNGVRLIQATDGDFYGTTFYGGSNRCGSGIALGCGTIFKFTPAGAFITLYDFGVGLTDGLSPSSWMIQGADGNFYGTTISGGVNQIGTVFRFIPPPSPTISGVFNGASFQSGVVADSWITINGANLSPKTDSWATTFVKGELPTQLDGVTVTFGQQSAYIAYVSPTQINALAPTVPAGKTMVTVSNSSGNSVATAAVQAVQPGLFQWGAYAVATRQDYSLAAKNSAVSGVATVPAKPGEVIILWGTGFGPTSPPAPEGFEVPGDAIYATANTVAVTVGGQPAMVYGAALTPGFAGLYQVAIQIPTSLANGDYPVVAMVSGTQSPSTTLITVQQ